LSSQNLGPCTLEGKFVKLEPLREKHGSALLLHVILVDCWVSYQLDLSLTLH